MVFKRCSIHFLGSNKRSSIMNIEQERVWIRRKLLGILSEAIEKGDKEKEKAVMDLMSITQIKGAK